jgi:hypothetical protein
VQDEPVPDPDVERTVHSTINEDSFAALRLRASSPA